jgi:prevent-host-death family protein
MKIVNIHAAKTQLSRLIAEVVAGEEVVISKAGTPLVRLVPVSAAGEPRVLGVLAGAVTEAPDCWEPDADLEALLYGEAQGGSPLRRVAEGPPAPAAATRWHQP